MGKKVLRTRNPTWWEKITGKARPTRNATFLEKITGRATPARPATYREKITGHATPTRSATFTEKLQGKGIPIRKPTWFEDPQPWGVQKPKPSKTDPYKSKLEYSHQKEQYCPSCRSKYDGIFCNICDDEENSESRLESQQKKHTLVRTEVSSKIEGSTITKTITKYTLTFKSEAEKKDYLDTTRETVEMLRAEGWEIEDDYLGYHEDEDDDND